MNDFFETLALYAMIEKGLVIAAVAAASAGLFTLAFYVTRT